MDHFAGRLLAWFDRHGRRDLPWQQERTPYSVWVSEIMLQQTQVATVVPYYERFMRRFPRLGDLAAASLDEVLTHWAGLGYYSRARNLHRTARQIVADFAGEFPADPMLLQSLPGIGRSTAGAILAQAFGQRGVILDGNVKRVLMRHAGIRDWPGTAAVQQQLWQLADRHTPDLRVADYTQAIMDLGATLCARKPDCVRCPLQEDCIALQEGLTAQIPARKPGKKLPTREIHMLVLRNAAGEVLLERRPPTGIWGGLWSLPECTGDELDRRLSTLPGKICIQGLLDPREHQFSHFRLRFTPVDIHYEAEGQQILDADERIWYKPGGEEMPGMPAPISTLLHQLAAEGN